MWRQEEGEKGERGTRCGSQDGKGTKRKGNQKDSLAASMERVAQPPGLESSGWKAGYASHIL